MKALSLFSGAGGFELGFERAGIETVLQAENDAWCLAVLERHWPEVTRVDDVRKVDATTQFRGSGDVARAGHRADAEPQRHANGTGRAAVDVDLIYGGFPCQDVSVAGKRAGLSGARSGLWHEFQRVLRELRPQWAAIENVPGLLSSNGGRDLAFILLALEELGYGWAYRILDARWFGVPQRRRRVVIVGCLGDPARAAQVLAVCESCGGHPAPSRQAKQDLAYALNASARGTGDGHGNAWNSNYVADDRPVTAFDWQASAGNDDSWQGKGRQHVVRSGDYAGAVSATRVDAVFGSEPAATQGGGGHPGSNMPGRHHEDDDNLVVGSQIDAGQARPLVARASGYRMDMESENFVVASPLEASDGHHGHSSPRGDGADNLIAQTLSSSYGKTTASGGSHGSQAPVQEAAGVRRLTPLECERLMGWPDDHTRYTADGVELADSHRYRLCGNGVVAPVAEWLGHRLVVAETLRVLHALGVEG